MDDAQTQVIWSFSHRSAAGRASILYFILNDLFKINSMYQFSLKAYSVVFKYALAQASPADDLESRILNLLDSITFQVIIDFIIITNLSTKMTAWASASFNFPGLKKCPERM